MMCETCKCVASFPVNLSHVDFGCAKILMKNFVHWVLKIFRRRFFFSLYKIDEKVGQIKYMREVLLLPRTFKLWSRNREINPWWIRNRWSTDSDFKCLGTYPKALDRKSKKSWNRKKKRFYHLWWRDISFSSFLISCPYLPTHDDRKST